MTAMRWSALIDWCRIDTYTSYAQWWEYEYHGPPQNPDKWWGHCHAWSGAAVWERQPPRYKVVRNGATGVQVKFRVRDRKGLMCEAYYNDASSERGRFYDQSTQSRSHVVLAASGN